MKACDGSGWVEPDYTLIAGYEDTESRCDSEDNDCDGEVDVFVAPELANKQDGVCAGAVKTCDGSAWIEPDYAACLLYTSPSPRD